jgi:hypothetical protein
MAKSSAAPVLGAAAGGVLSSGAGLGAVGCKPDDTSFYCRSSRLVMNLKNILFILLCIALVFYLFKNRKQFMG